MSRKCNNLFSLNTEQNGISKDLSDKIPVTRSEQQSDQRSHRPKRALSKSNDDNILGISWKEEQELRKAISLRSGLANQSRIAASNKLKSDVLKSRSVIQFKHVRKQSRSRLVAENNTFSETSCDKERSIKKDAVKCGSAQSSKPSSACSGSKTEIVKVPQTTSHIQLRNLYHRRKLADESNINNHLDDSSHKDQPSSPPKTMGEDSSKRVTAEPDCGQRPTLITASNYLKSDPCDTNTIQRKHTTRRRSSCSSPLGKEFQSDHVDKFATCSSPKRSKQSSRRKSKRLINLVSPVSPLPRESDDNASKCFTNGDCYRDLQMLLKLQNEPIPLNFGRTLLVDLFQFMILSTLYASMIAQVLIIRMQNGSPFHTPYEDNLLDKLHEHVKRCNVASHCENNNTVNSSPVCISVTNSQPTKSLPVTRSTVFCVAKKLAYIQPSRSTYPACTPTSSSLKMVVNDGDQPPVEYHPSTGDNKSSQTTVKPPVASHLSSRQRRSKQNQTVKLGFQLLKIICHLQFLSYHQ
ncbi:unnamed protein product [Heterobilharzia americana]|nr:unnamed protein product [Heterobilharzia americana]